jgi:hypothetical protein
MINTNWQTIDTAPKDGTPIFITHPNWAGAIKAHWGKYPGGLVEDSKGRETTMYGWIFDNWTRFQGLCPHENGFLGFDDDIENEEVFEEGGMPTHWCWPPTTEEKNDG